MKIIIFFTYNQGFLSEFFKQISTLFHQDGHKVSGFFLKNQKKDFIVNNVHYVGYEKGNYALNFWRIYRFIKTNKPDIIISNFGYINSALVAGKLLKVPKNIAWMHTGYQHHRPSKNWVRIKRKIFRLADLVIINSEVLRREMVLIYKVADSKIKCVPFWSTILDFPEKEIKIDDNERDDYLNIGCPGRILNDKNHITVLKVLKMLREKGYPDFRFYIAGVGNYKKELLEFVKENELQGCVHFLNNLNSEEMVSFYKKMDLVILPSVYEAFGLVFIESIAMETPVLVSNRFGALRFIDKSEYDVGSFSFDPYSTEEIYRKLMPYIQGNGKPGKYFKELYEETFVAQKIFKDLKMSVLNVDRKEEVV